jgi:hypothetical protein
MTDGKVKFVFKSGEPRLVAWPCTISVPLDGGARQEQSIVARFKVLAPEKIAELAGNGDRALLDAVIDGFDELKNEAGKPVPDKEAKAALLALPYAIEGLLVGYGDMIGRRLSKN